MADLSALSNDQLLALAGQHGPASSAAPPVVGANRFGQDFSALTNGQLLALAANSNPKMSGAEDVGRSVTTGLERAATGLQGTPAMIRDAFANLPQTASNVAQWGLQKAGLEPQGQQNAPAPNPVAIAGQAGNLPALLSGLMPNTQHLDQRTQALLGPYHTPQTPAGHYAARIAENAPLLMGPESLLAKGATALGAGVGSQSLEDMAPEALKPYAAMLGEALGGGAVAGARAIKNAPQAALAKALKSASPADIAQATDLMRTGRALPGGGVAVTPYEALGHVTGSPAAPRIQHFLENARGTNVDVGNLFSQQRPAQVSSTVNALADSIAPAPAQPGMLGQQVQQSAQGALDNVQSGINSATRPLYEAAEGQLVPKPDYEALSANPSYQKAYAAVRGNPELNGPIAALPDNSIAVVDAVKKQLGTLQTAARQTEMNPAGDNYLASLRGQAQGSVTDAARAASPEYAQALDQQAAMRQEQLAPLQAGALGKVAAKDDLTAQLGELFGGSPTVGASNETAQAVQALGPDLGKQLAAQHIRDTFNSSSRDLVTGPNAYAGSKFAKDIAGHAEQARALADGLSAAGVNPDAPGGVNDALDVLRATGQRQAPGSGTAFNQQQRDALGMAPKMVRALGAVFDPLEYGKHLSGAVGKVMYGRQLDHFAQLLNASPEQAESMLNAARSNSSKSALMGRMLLGAPSSTTSP